MEQDTTEEKTSFNLSQSRQARNKEQINSEQRITRHITTIPISGTALAVRRAGLFKAENARLHYRQLHDRRAHYQLFAGLTPKTTIKSITRQDTTEQITTHFSRPWSGEGMSLQVQCET